MPSATPPRSPSGEERAKHLRRSRQRDGKLRASIERRIATMRRIARELRARRQATGGK